ncbi:MAG: AMP-binding protein [Pirellulaceae bacterium]|nr:AMP-binding protein [Pirellulaceae bacterium]
MDSCLAHCLQALGETRPDRPAILAPDRPTLNYAELWRQFRETAVVLRSAGIEGNDRVAIVLPNGAEMATCFLCVAGVATAAPLNPAYRESEFDFYLTDLNTRAVIVGSDLASPVAELARQRNIPVIALRACSDGAAGRFSLSPMNEPDSRRVDFAEPDDIALVLHTSGTTSKPKMVPLSHRNILASAENIRVSLNLGEDDRCLNVMPLFHIHGLVGALLASLVVGGSVVCGRGFDAGTFFPIVDQHQPTWYTAVPTMHQAVLAEADRDPDVLNRHRLRFIRSCSSALPPTVMENLERKFGVPVVEAYGMTEAAHQMTCNPLPPAPRKPGSVGVPTGVEVAVMSEHGDLLPCGANGEVVIRGANVTGGYANRPEANAQAFTNGWFRTGDQGRFDEDGYLYLTGRLKEMINRGGENISPREIDEVLLEHPDVIQALTFAVAHPTLGENVAAAVVSRPGATLTGTQLRDFLAGRLSDYKIPQRWVFLDEIPKGPTGKPQRIGLAERLGLNGDDVPGDPASEAIEDPLEAALAAIWSEVLGRPAVGREDNFFDLGGDSLRATRITNRIRRDLRVEVQLGWLFEFPTLAELAHRIAASNPASVSIGQGGAKVSAAA